MMGSIVITFLICWTPFIVMFTRYTYSYPLDTQLYMLTVAVLVLHYFVIVLYNLLKTLTITFNSSKALWIHTQNIRKVFNLEREQKREKLESRILYMKIYNMSIVVPDQFAHVLEEHLQRESSSG